MKTLTLTQALTLLHVRTVALENIRRRHGDDLPQTGAQAIAGEALTMGPGSSGLCDLLANAPADTDTGGGLACPRCGWDELQPSEGPRDDHRGRRYPVGDCSCPPCQVARRLNGDDPRTVRTKDGKRHRPDCRRYVSEACAVAVECEHGFSVCSACDRCTCDDPAPAAFVCVACNAGREKPEGPCPKCGGTFAGIPNVSGASVWGQPLGRRKPRPAPKTCPECDGYGTDTAGESPVCPRCKGSGMKP